MHLTLAELAKRWLKSKPENLSESETRVLQSAIERRTISRDVNDIQDQQGSRGDRIADAIARVGGSWSFILSFILFLALWTIGNTLLNGTFDPYPFIFLNLVLSMIAALQAPVIMMSQNRQTEHDRMDAAHDYEVNLKAEIEIMALHEKFDEMRHQDMLILRDQITEMGKLIERMNDRLAELSSSK
jgi:uncharacterized membrane protein